MVANPIVMIAFFIHLHIIIMIDVKNVKKKSQIVEKHRFY